MSGARLLRPLTLALVVGLAVPAAYAQRGREPDSSSRNSSEVLEMFEEIVRDAVKSTVHVSIDGERVACGTVITEDGLILTKASELDGEMTCSFADDREMKAALVAKDEAWDLALVKVEATDLTPVRWATDDELLPGRIVITPAAGEAPLSMGIISSEPRRVTGGNGYLGVMLGDPPEGQRGALVTEVTAGSAAEEAGLEVGDVIVGVNKEELDDRQDLVRAIQSQRAGDEVSLSVKRAAETLTLEAILRMRPAETGARSRFSRGRGFDGQTSEIKGGFARAIQHDSVLSPRDCGGPLVNLQGKVVAVNIARAGRINTYAIPATEVIELVKSLRSGAQ